MARILKTFTIVAPVTLRMETLVRLNLPIGKHFTILAPCKTTLVPTKTSPLKRFPQLILASHAHQLVTIAADMDQPVMLHRL